MKRPRMPRCWCGHGHDAHKHYRPGNECGACGWQMCHEYAPRDRDMPDSHRLVAAMSDAHAMANLAALMPFAVSTRPPPPLPIPAQRKPPRRPGGQIVDVATLQRPRPDRRPR